MTPREYDEWWADTALRFPGVSRWLLTVYPSQEERRSFHRTWLHVLSDVELGDALEVNRQMQRGDMPWVGQFPDDQQLLPQHVRRLVFTLDTEPVSSGRDPYELIRRDGDAFPGAKILRRMWQLTSQGISREQAREQALAEFPIGGKRAADGYGPRFECATCLDLGSVLVASNEAIEAAIRGELPQCHRRVASMRCPCTRGQRLRMQTGGKKKRRELPWETFDPTLDFKVEDPLWPATELARLEAWATGQLDQFTEQKFAAFGAASGG